MIQIQWWSRSSDDVQWWSRSNDDIQWWWSRSSDDPDLEMKMTWRWIWLDYIIYLPNRNIGVWHDTSTSQNKHRVTIDKKYKWIHSEVTITLTDRECRTQRGIHLDPVAAFRSLGSRGRNIQATRCVLGGKSWVKDVTLFLTPRLGSTPNEAKRGRPY